MTELKTHTYTFTALILILISIMGCGKSKLYIDPVNNYAISNSDFSFLDDEARNNIGLFMSIAVDWFDSIEFKGENCSIPLEELDNDSMKKYGKALLDFEQENIYNKKDTLSVIPAANIYGAYLDIILNNEREISIGTKSAGSTDYSINVSYDDWNALHDQIKDAMAFYYGDGDRSALNNEPDTNYIILSEGEETALKNDIKGVVYNPDVTSDITVKQDSSTGSVKVALNMTQWESKIDYLKLSPLDYDPTIAAGSGLTKALNKYLDKYKKDFPSIVAETRFITSDDELIIAFNEEGDIVFEATDEEGRNHQDYVDMLGFTKLRKVKDYKNDCAVKGDKFKSAKEIYAIYNSIIKNQTDGSCDVIFSDRWGLTVSYNDNPLIAIECQNEKCDTLTENDNTKPDRLVFLDFTNPRSQPCLEHMAFFLQGIIGEMSYDEVLQYIRTQSSNGGNGTYIFGSCFAINGKLFELVIGKEYGMWFSENHIDYAKLDALDAIHDIYWLDEEKEGFYSRSEDDCKKMLEYYKDHEIDYIARYNDMKLLID